MNKFIKFTIAAIVALLAISFVHALDARAAEPEALNLARQETTDAADAEEPKTSSLLPSLPLPSAVPTESVNTLAKGDATTSSPPLASAAPSGGYYTPTGTGTLISSWASLTAHAPVSQPSGPPSPPVTPTKATDVNSSAHKIETGLFSAAIVAAIVSFFF